MVQRPRGRPAGRTDLLHRRQRPDGDFDDIADADAEADFATFLAECERLPGGRSRACRWSTSSSIRGGRSEMSLRWVYVHMIEEYARHNGHADLIRERIDGATGE